MAEKTLNTRMQQKHDVEANWKKATGFVPKAGEIIVYDKDTTYSYPRIKIGDGTRTVTALPFVTTSVNGSTGDVRITASDIGAADVNEVEDLKEEVTLASAYALKTLINGGDYNNLLNRPCYKEITSASYTIKNDPIVGMTSAFEGAPTPLRQIPDIPSSILSQPLSMTVLMNDNGEVEEIPLTTEVANAGEWAPGAEIYYHISSMLDDLPFIFIKTTGPMPELSIPHAGTFYIDILFSYIISMSSTADLSLTINFPNEITIPGKQLDDVLISDNIARLDDIPVQSVNGKTGAVVINAADVGADVSGAANTALNSAKSYTDAEIAEWVGNKTVSSQISTAIAGLVDSSPDTLNTLNELAAALGDDPNFATTVANQIGNKVDKTTTVNGKALSNNITLSASDVGALPDTTVIPSIEGLATESGLISGQYIIFSASGTGTTYSATIEGITTLNTGMILVMIPDTTSTSRTGITLNINDLGAKNLYRRNVEGNLGYGMTNDWLKAGTPYIILYGGSYWEVVSKPIPAASDLSGSVPINKGGTGATDAATARTNLGITPANIGAATATDITNALSSYAKKTEVPSIEGLATETYVDEAIEAIPETYLSDYYTKDQTTTQINNAISTINFPVKSVNGKTGEVNLAASDVNAEKAGAVAAAIDALRIKNGNNISIRSAWSAEDDSEYSIGYHAIALGDDSKASGTHSYAEGSDTTASGGQSHAEGRDTTASGGASHAEGFNTTASGGASHAEGMDTTASGEESHAEGYNTTASGGQSHAEGYNTVASGKQSHTEGLNTIASSDNQHVQGKYNLDDTANKYAHIVGNGGADTNRSNAHTLDWSGLGWFAGGLKIGGTGQDDENAVSVLTENDLTAITESEIDTICGNTNVETWQFTMTDGTITEKQVVVSE